MRILRRTSCKPSQLEKEIAPLSARRELQENIRLEQAKLKNSGISDKAQVQKNIREWQKQLDRATPENLNSETKNAMWKRAKQLKDEFTVGMLTTDELHPVSKIERNGTISVVVDEGKMANANCARRQAAWDKKMGDKVREYKNIMRHLCPDDPSATDIERFRGKRRVK